MSAIAPEGEARPASLPHARDGGDLGLTLALTFAAGSVDAIGYLAFGGVFVSFMSCDTTRLGASLARGAGGLAMLFGGVVALFVVGAAAAHALVEAPARRPRGAALMLVTPLLVMAAVAGRLGWAAATLVLVAPSMGALSTASARAQGVSVTPTYVTGTLVRLGGALADCALGRGDRRRVVTLLSQWAAMLAGAAAGAWLFDRGGLSALVAPAALVFSLTAAVLLSPALRPARSEP